YSQHYFAIWFCNHKKISFNQQHRRAGTATNPVASGPQTAPIPRKSCVMLCNLFDPGIRELN
ncbi:MAG TPA: hypothetical protein VK484_04500, partial [Ferruginibacter sp.]|nr:hypothetical protein [Ferruginibacter sp.]